MDRLTLIKKGTPILEAIKRTIEEAKATDSLVYLHQGPSGFFTSRDWAKNWLFQAWPGGRKVLSVTGKKLVEQTHCLCGREWSYMSYCYYCEKWKGS